MFKKISKQILTVVIVGMLFVTGSAFAASTNQSNTIPTVKVTNKNLSNSSWSNHTDIDSSKKLAVQLHYYLNEGNSATNMRFSMDDLDGKTFNKGQTITVHGKVMASNLSTSYGTSTVTFTEKVKLHLYNVSWQKTGCKSVGCESTLVDSYSKVLTSGGMSIGNVSGEDSHYNGNVIVEFKVEKINTPDPIDGGWTNWTVDHNGSYGACSNGTKTRNVYYKRSCTNPAPANGGANCSGSTTKTETETVSCSNPVEADVDTNSATAITRTSAKLNGDTDGTPVEDKWFAFSRIDSTPSCSSDSQRVEANGGDNFYKYQRGLTCGETYYFRACGEGENGNIDSGTIRSFRTNQCETTKEDAVVYTNSATNIYSASAQLNGRVVVNDTENAKVYFIYGTSASNMNRQTSYLGVSRNTVFKAITGLNAGTRYYFQAIVRDGNGIVDRGIIRSFVTKSAIRPAVTGRCGSRANTCARGYFVNTKDSTSYIRWNCVGYNGGRTATCSVKKYVKTTKKPVVVSKPIEVVVKTETTTTAETGKYYEEKGLEITKTVGKSRTGTFGVSTTAKAGDTVFYKIRVKNTSNEVVDVKVEDFLPKELDDKDGTTADSDRYMTWVLKMNPGESKVFLKELVVDKDVIKGEIIDSAAKITVDDKTEDTNNVEITIVGDNFGTGNDNAASIFGANSSFFPTSIVGWLAVLLLGLGVLFLGTKVFTTAARKD